MGANCRDCGLPYADFGLDLVLPDQEWKPICPEGGLLCANCIGRRARKFGASVMLCWIDRIDWSLVDQSRWPSHEDARLSAPAAEPSCGTCLGTGEVYDLGKPGACPSCAPPPEAWTVETLAEALYYAFWNGNCSPWTPERLKGSTFEHLARIALFAPAASAKEVCEMCGGVGRIVSVDKFIAGDFRGDKPCPRCTPTAGEGRER